MRSILINSLKENEMKITKTTMTIVIECSSPDTLQHLVHKMSHNFHVDPESVKYGTRFPDGDSIHWVVEQEEVKV